MSIVRDVEQVHKFLHVHGQAAAEAIHAEVVQTQCKQLALKFRTSAMSVDEATQVLEALTAAGPWTAAQAQELRAACASSVRPAGATGSTSQRTQVFLDPESFLTPAVWKVMESSAYSEKAKLHCYCTLLNKLGLAAPSEKTTQHCTAKFWLAIRGKEALQFDGSTMRALSDELKQMLSSLPAPPHLRPNFPSDPECFRKEDPDAFALVYNEEPPEASRLEHEDVAKVLKNWPCRNSHRSVKGATGVLALPGVMTASTSNPMMHMQQMMVNAMGQIFQQMSSSSGQSPQQQQQPQLKMLHLHGKHHGGSLLAKKASEVALESAHLPRDQQEPCMLPLQQPPAAAFHMQAPPLQQHLALLEAPEPPLQAPPLQQHPALEAPEPPLLDDPNPKSWMAAQAQGALAMPSVGALSVGSGVSVEELEAQMANASKKAAADANLKRPASEALDAEKTEGATAKTGKKGKKPEIMKRPAGAMPEIMKRPAGAMTGGPKAAGRPKVPVDADGQAPVLYYLGGKIYDDDKGKRLRCYVQIGDKVEKSISYKTRSRAHCYRAAFEAIEKDPRVNV